MDNRVADPYSSRVSRVWRSTGQGALGADRLDLDRGGIQAKPERTGALLEGAIQDGIFNLCDPTASATYQELTGMSIFGSVASEERVERI